MSMFQYRASNNAPAQTDTTMMQRSEGRIVSLTAPKKSRTRTGCARCKQLHHKCTEERPRCVRCVKFNSTCVYAEPLRSKDGHNINNVRRSTALATARESKQGNMHSTSSEGSPNSSGSSPPIEVVLYRPSDTRQRDSMGVFLHQFTNMAEYMNSKLIIGKSDMLITAWCIPIVDAQETSIVRSSWATSYLPRLAQGSEALSNAICCYAAHRMGIPDLAVAYYQESVQSLRQNLFALQHGTQLSIAELLEMWCTTYVLSEVEGLIGQFDAITLHIRGALQLYKLLAKRLRQSARNKDLNPELSRNYEYLIGNMAVCSIKSMQLPEQVAEIPTCFDLPNQPVGTLLGHGGECFIMMNAFRRKFPFRLRSDNPMFDAYAVELNAVLNRLQAHRDEILAIPGSECVQSVTNSPFSPTIVFVDENLTMPFCATHLVLLMMAPHLEEDLLHHTTRNAMGILLGMSPNKQTSRGKHFALIGAYLQDPTQRAAFLQHCDMMSLELGIPAFTKVKELAQRCWALLKERYHDRVQDLSCQLIPLMTSVTGPSEGQQGLTLRPASGSPGA